MPGGSDEAWETLGPILKSIAAVAEGEPCVTHVGTDGAGHFVKMIHNGIEYADMQLIAEAYDLIRRGTGQDAAEIADVFAEWNKGELESYLIEITAEVLRQVDAETGKPLVDVILDQAGSKGTGVWTVQTALDLGVPVGGIAEAVFARAVSASPRSARRSRGVAGDASGARRRRATPSTTTCAWRSTRRRSSPTRRASTRSSPAPSSTTGTSTWASIAKIWRGGCIIRARFLNRIAEAYAETPGLVDAARRPRTSSTSIGRRRGRVAPDRRDARRSPASPRPAFSSSLAYYDGLASERLPAALVQGQRDFFGAHTYKRVDKPGTFHTLWSGDRSEVRTDG